MRVPNKHEEERGVTSSAFRLKTGVCMKLVVDPSYANRFVIRENQLECLTCDRIIHAHACNNLETVRINLGCEVSVLVNKIYVVPHACLLSILKQVEAFKAGRLMKYDMYTNWMNVNSDNYQLGDSSKCMKLWDSFTRYPQRRPVCDYTRVLELVLGRAVKLKQCKAHRGYYPVIVWGAVKARSDLAVINNIWTWSSEADHTKTCVSAQDMIWHMRRYPEMRKRYDKWAHLFSVNLSNVTVTALLMHVVGNPSYECVFMLMCKWKHCCLNTDEYVEVLKNMSVALRRTARWPTGEAASLDEVTQCAGWELAIGRSSNRSDWADEEEKRTKHVVHLSPPTEVKKDAHTNAEYLKLLRVELHDIMAEWIKLPRSQVSWREFAEARQSWVSSGSTGGKKLKLSDGSAVRINKHAYFEGVTTDEMVGWLEQEPVMQATASEKFEMGKARAIYGTGVVDYSVAAYALDGLEDKMHNIDGIESGLTGLDYVVAIVRRLTKVQEPLTECSMIDYRDFNYQHTLEAQSEVFVALGERLRIMNYHHDRNRACEWLAKAFLNQWCKFPGRKRKPVQVTQGMFSGCRPTNMINTILNVAYFRVACRWVSENLGLRPVDLFNIHQGDDVWISNKSRLWAIAVYECMQASGLIFQASKQMFDINRGEFLRVVYTDQGCQGYLARALGTLIMKPIQNTDVVAPIERASALNSQIMILKRRGFTQEGCQLVWAAVVPYAARATLVEGALTVPVAYLQKSYLDNGADLGVPGSAAVRSQVVRSAPTMELGSAELENSVPTLMSRDWVNIMSRRLRADIDYESLVRQLHTTNVADSLRQEDRIMSLRHHERELRKWLSTLDPGPVVRTEAAYRELFEGELASSTFDSQLLRVQDNVLRKNTQEPAQVMGTIMRAITSSPYKGLANAKIATGCSTIPAAYAAIAACPHPTVASLAAAYVTNLRATLTDEKVSNILDGIRAGATIFECDYHPILLSWVEGKALEETLLLAMAGGDDKDSSMNEQLANCMRKYIRSLEKYPVFKQLSRF